jgi:hypothetical protein
MAVYARGEIRIQRSIALKRAVAAAESTAPATTAVPVGRAPEDTNLERSRI